MSKNVLTLEPTATSVDQVDVACCPPLASEPLDADNAAQMAHMFKALGDPARLRLLSLIATAADGECCVNDLCCAFDLSGPTISHHLKVLREAGLVESARRGTWIYYRPQQQNLARLSTLLSAPGLTC